MRIATISFVTLASAIIFSYNTYSQSNFNLEIEQNIQGSDLIIDFYIQKTSGNDFELGSSDFAIELSSENLDLSNKIKVDSLDGPWDNGTDPNSYIAMGLGGSNFINLTVSRKTSGSGTGQAVTSARTRIGRILIPITNSCGTNTVTWIKKPVAINGFATGNIKSFANFIDPAPGFSLCNIPVIPGISATGNTTICDGESFLLTTDYSGAVQWYLNGVEIAGATKATFSANITGNYSVKITDCSCGDFSAIITVSVNSVPVVPVITQSGNVLTSSTGNAIQWYLNGNLISGATQQTYTPTISGDYTVAASNTCGTTFADPISFILSGIVELNKQHGFYAYPNPYYTETKISYYLSDNSEVLLEVYNILGKKIYTLVNGLQKNGEHTSKFSAKNLGYPSGVYFLKLKIGNKEQMLKLVVLD